MFEKSNQRPKKVNTSSFELPSFSWLGSKIQALIPNDLKDINSLSTFKDKLKRLNLKIALASSAKNIYRGQVT